MREAIWKPCARTACISHFALIAIAASPTHAILPGVGCSCAAIGGFHGETRQHVTRETTDAAAYIVEALRRHSSQNSKYMDRQVEALERITDGQEQNEAMRLRDRFRAEAESGKYDPNPDFCHQVDIALESRSGPAPVEATGARISAAVAGWSTGAVLPVQVNGARMAAWLAAEREEIRNAGGSDDATTDWRLATSHPTLQVDDPDVARAIARLIANTVDPVPPSPLTEEDLQTPAGLSEAAWRRATEARNRAAIAAIGQILDIASPSQPAGPYRTIARRSRYDESIPDQISELQILDIRSTSYYSPNVETLEQRHSKNEKALLQDLLDVQSLNARLNYLRLLQEMRSVVVLASILGILTDGSTSNLSRP